MLKALNDNDADADAAAPETDQAAASEEQMPNPEDITKLSLIHI